MGEVVVGELTSARHAAPSTQHGPNGTVLGIRVHNGEESGVRARLHYLIVPWATCLVSHFEPLVIEQAHEVSSPNCVGLIREVELR